MAGRRHDCPVCFGFGVLHKVETAVRERGILGRLDEHTIMQGLNHSGPLRPSVTVTECPARTSPVAKVRNVSSTPPPIPDPSGPTDVDTKMIRMGVNPTTIRWPTDSRLPTNTNRAEEPTATRPGVDPSE